MLTVLKKIRVPLLILLVLFALGQPLRASAGVDLSTTGASTPAAGTTTFSPTDFSCGLSLDGKNLAICVSNFVYYIMVGLFSSIAYICAFFFDLAVQLSLNSGSYALAFLTTAWQTTRDIANMSFIFILVYIALIIMFEADTTSTTRMLATVIIVALLVNFSFFFTRVVIDAGNIVAVQFYNAISAPMIGQTVANNGLASITGAGATVTAAASGGQTKDLTAGIMNALQLQNLFSNPSFQSFASDKSNSAMYLLIVLSLLYFFMGIMFAILAGSFLFAGAKFMMRIVGLWIVLLASPIAMTARTLGVRMGWAKNMWDLWFKSLLEFTFYPAIYLFMFWVLSLFMKDLAQQGFLNQIFSSGASSNASYISVIASAIANVGIRMAFVVGMMYAALSVADMVVKTGSGWAKSFSGFMGNAVTGGAIGYLGRKTFGQLGQMGIARAQRQGIAPSSLDTMAANATFDPRNSRVARYTGIAPLLRAFQPTTEKTGKMVNGALPIDFGKAQTGADLKRAAQERERDAEARRRERATATRDAANKAAIERLTNDKYAPGPAGAAAKKADEDRVKSLGKRELDTLKNKDIEKILKYVSEGQLKIVEANDKFTEDEKDKFRKTWSEKSSDTPLAKAQRILTNELRSLAGAIRTTGINLATVTTNTAAGQIMNGANVAAMRDNINDQVAEIRSRIRNTPTGGSTQVLQRDLMKLENAHKSLDRLDDERKKVPADVGGQANAGEFLVK